MINIKGNEYSYDQGEVVSFSEGLVGLPQMRNAVIVPMEGCEPFCWLASTEDEGMRFVVVDPQDVYSGYEALSAGDPQNIKTLAIVRVSSDWQKTTINLRAPIVIDLAQRRGAQFILTESNYSLTEPLPQN